ncbi:MULTISPECIES: hypothetical protein [unclassified Pseudonocardia]|uniref:hypothetical protein n=1 Tax=unclassified Pseudonocardia TaxID=2619320 RepID=UPI00158D9BA0|nr:MULTISPECIES: hypothetical protein [unclassified Pseudonocardia]
MRPGRRGVARGREPRGPAGHGLSGEGTGRRYLGHADQGSHVVLFVRDSPGDDIGPGAPFLCLGACTYVSHEGRKPIAITWKVRRAMPGETFRAASVVAS